MVRKHLPLFELLAQITDDQRKSIVKTLTQQQLRAVLEAIYNVLKGTCELEDKDKKKLFPHRHVIRRLVSKDINQKQQRRLLHKHVNLLGILLKPVVKALKHD